MRLTQKNINRNSLSWVLPLIVLLLISLLSSTAVAADYYVWGRVYSAYALAEGEEEPNNPLDDVPDGQIIGDGLFAVTPRNLVQVRVIDASNGTELGSSETVTKDGGYLVSFSTLTGGNIEVRFVVEELSTSKILLESDPNELSPWPTPNIRFLLAHESLAVVGDDREFALSAPGTHTGIFTRIGKIEVETEVGGTTHRLIDYSTGRVTVPQVVSDDLHIPKYQDAPLGGNLYMFGAFDQPLYGSGALYCIKIENLDTSTVTYMTDPLVKTKYTVDLTPGMTPTVDTERVTLGPKPHPSSGDPNCYEMTDLSTSIGDVHTFWSFPDLLALWRTGGLNGKYKVSLELVNLPSVSSFVPMPGFTDVNLFLDNVPPVAEILPLGLGDELHPTPRVYIPDPPDTTIGCDLTFPRLGNWSVDYGGTANPVCSILDLQGPVGSEYLAFKLTAHHDNGDGIGYLRYWHFGYRRNDMNYDQIHIGKFFDGASMANYSTAQFDSNEKDTNGFEDKFLYLNKSYLEPGIGTSLGGCAYRFVIRAATRTTDGYNYLRWAWDDDIHYLLR